VKGTPARSARFAGLIVLLVGAAAGPAAAQVLPDPQPPGDTLVAPPPEPEAGVVQVAPEPDSVRPPRNLPSLSPPVPAGPETGIWEWDREGLLATRAFTLTELMERIPGTVPIRGGDYGMPVTVSAFGAAGGRIQVFRDGIEWLPLSGGVADLSQVLLMGLDRVRVERRPGEVRVYLYSRTFDDPRPQSMIEAGTGDLQTNLFRGSFLHPDVAGGNFSVVLDRVDTRGPQGREPGAVTGAWLRYGLLGDRGGVALEFQSAGTQRDTLYLPAEVIRTQLGIRGGMRLLGPAVGEVYLSRARWSGDGFPDPRDDPGSWTRDQAGLRLGAASPRVWGAVHGRRIGGEGWPLWGGEATTGGVLPGIGGAEAVGSLERGGGKGARALHLRGWTEPRWGLSLFGEWTDGTRGIPYRPPAPPAPPGEEEEEGEGDPPHLLVPPDPGPRFTTGTGVRTGASVHFRGVQISGGYLTIEVDSLATTGLPFDRNALSVSGGRRTGWEVMGRLPLPVLPGLALEGWLQEWSDAPGESSWRFLPRRNYDARLAFHDLFLPSGNLEVWFDVGVRGRDGMLLNPLSVGEEEMAEPRGVPFQQSWSTRLQIRVVSVRVFAVWDNFTLRPGNQDVPGRRLPQTRALYGVRWTLWN